MNTNRTMLRRSAALILCAALAACGDDDPTGPDTMGTVSAEMHDDIGAAGAPAMTAAPEQAAAGSFSGTASGSAQVFIYSDAEGWVELGSPTNANLTLQSGDRTQLYGSASVPAGSYTRVRLVMEDFDANIGAGAVIGGLTLSADVSIVMGGADGRVEIEKTVTPFTVTAESSTTIGFDLNSETWVTEQAAESQTAADTEIQSASSAYIQS